MLIELWFLKLGMCKSVAIPPGWDARVSQSPLPIPPSPHPPPYYLTDSLNNSLVLIAHLHLQENKVSSPRKHNNDNNYQITTMFYTGPKPKTFCVVQ